MLECKSGVSYFEIIGAHGQTSVSLPGAKVGDLVVRLWGKVLPPPGALNDYSTDFEAVISVDDEIQMVSYKDLTGAALAGILLT